MIASSPIVVAIEIESEAYRRAVVQADRLREQRQRLIDLDRAMRPVIDSLTIDLRRIEGTIRAAVAQVEHEIEEAEQAMIEAWDAGCELRTVRRSERRMG